MAGQKYDKNACIALLRDKQQSLSVQGLERFPQRGDFDVEQVVAIKAAFGPWPRALEAAGIKPPRPGDPKKCTREKHIRSKRGRTGVLKAQKPQNKSSPDGFVINDSHNSIHKNNIK